RDFSSSVEYREKGCGRSITPQRPWCQCAPACAPEEVIQRHAACDLVPRPGRLTGVLFVVYNHNFFTTILTYREGQFESIPIQAYRHADIAAWGPALRAVDLSDDTFTMIELGCGWGCWMNNCGVAARASGRRVHVIGIEGDEGHLAFAR